MTITAPRIPRDQAGRLHARDGGAPPASSCASRPAPSLEHVGQLLVRPGRAAGQHRELHRRRAGADRHRRSAADQRRARAGRVLRAAGDDRGHARRQLQPRHAAADRMRRRQDDRRRGPACSARRCSSSTTRLQAREFGEWVDEHDDEIRAVAEATTRSGKLTTSASTRSVRCATCASTTRPATPPGRT